MVNFAMSLARACKQFFISSKRAFIIETLFFTLGFCTSIHAQGDDAQTAIKILSKCLECEDPPETARCGISCGYARSSYEGDAQTLKIVTKITMVKGSAVYIDTARYRDFDPARIEQRGTAVTLMCSGGHKCVQSNSNSTCLPNYACPEDEIGTTSERKPELMLAFCDEKTASNAKVAFDVLLRSNELVLSKSRATSKPSFDCDVASGVVEQAICADEALSVKDASLKEVYSRLRRGLNADDRRSLLNEQRAWLTSRDQCTGSKLVACVGDLYDRRIRELQGRLSVK
jgi:uncharacterized protein YecT (DUF1311 family)